MRLDAYVRVSRIGGREGPSFISPDTQTDAIRRWAKAHQATILAEHVDLDQSGAKTDRPGFQAVLTRIENQETGGVVVAKLDRFGRSLTDALAAIRRIDDAGGKFVSVAEQFDTGTPVGKLVLRIMLTLAEFELDRIRESWQNARQRAVARGVHVASRTPTGYIRAADGTLAPHPKDSEVVGELFRMRADGASWGQLAGHLNQHAVTGPYRQANWTPRPLQHIIRNRVYLGEARSGEFVNAHAHPPLVDRLTWERAQQAKGPPAVRGNHPALLAGLLRCAGCRYAMKPDRMNTRDGTKARIYRCRGDHSSGRCPDRSAALASVVEPFVERAFLARVGELGAAAKAADRSLGPLEQTVLEAEAELAAFRDDERILGALGQSGFVAGLQVRAQTLDDARRELEAARAKIGAAGLPDPATLHGLWPDLSVVEKQKLLGAGVSCIFLRSGRSLPIADRALILWAGEAPDDLPRRGRRVPLHHFEWPVDLPPDARIASVEDGDERGL